MSQQLHVPLSSRETRVQRVMQMLVDAHHEAGLEEPRKRTNSSANAGKSPYRVLAEQLCEHGI